MKDGCGIVRNGPADLGTNPAHLKDFGMRAYRSVPMSFADACLVRMSELYPKAPMFTLDAHFRVYRRNRRQIFPVLCP
jgi:hypothetical protein